MRLQATRGIYGTRPSLKPMWFPMQTQVYDVDKFKIQNCSHCKALIIHGDVIIGNYQSISEIYHLDCYIKTPNFVNNNWPDCTQNLIGFNELYSYHQQQIKKIIFPSISPIKFQLKCSFDIDDLIGEEGLKAMLKARDLKVYTQYSKWSKPQWKFVNGVHNLEKFVLTDEYRNKKECLVFGYCEYCIAKKYKMLIPTVIKTLILQFCAMI